MNVPKNKNNYSASQSKTIVKVKDLIVTEV